MQRVSHLDLAMNESLGVCTKTNCSPMASEAIYVNSERTVKTCLI